MTKPIFYYANGTAYAFNWLAFEVSQDFQNIKLFGKPIGQIHESPTIHVKGLNGQFHLWSGGIPNDPFPLLLDSNLWQYKRVPYPASMIFMGPSIEAGMNWVLNDIQKYPIGTPFALGGYSQGAAVMSCVYNALRDTRLRSRRHDLRAVVTFGNPMREKNHRWPGASSWDGACDVPGSKTGGHGTFPSINDIGLNLYTRRFARLVNTEPFFWDFVMPNEVISGVGDSANGKFLSAWTKMGLTLNPLWALSDMGKAMALWNQFGVAPPTAPQDTSSSSPTYRQVKFTDPKTGATGYMAGGGHIMYPHFPPPAADGSIPTTGDTCYQIAAKYINSIGAQISTEGKYVAPTAARPSRYRWATSR